MKMPNVARKIGNLPRPLEEQIWIRCGIGLALALGGIILLCSTGLYVGLPLLLVSGYMMGSGFQLALNCLAGKYTAIKGDCRQVETAGLRKRARAIVLSVENTLVRIQLHQRRCSIQEGDGVIVYVSDRTPVYVKDGCDYICSYYALEVSDGSCHSQTQYRKKERRAEKPRV